MNKNLILAAILVGASCFQMKTSATVFSSSMLSLKVLRGLKLLTGAMAVGVAGGVFGKCMLKAYKKRVSNDYCRLLFDIKKAVPTDKNSLIFTSKNYPFVNKNVLSAVCDYLRAKNMVLEPGMSPMMTFARKNYSNEQFAVLKNILNIHFPLEYAEEYAEDFWLSVYAEQGEVLFNSNDRELLKI